MEGLKLDSDARLDIITYWLFKRKVVFFRDGDGQRFFFLKYKREKEKTNANTSYENLPNKN